MIFDRNEKKQVVALLGDISEKALERVGDDFLDIEEHGISATGNTYFLLICFRVLSGMLPLQMPHFWVLQHRDFCRTFAPTKF